MWYYIARFICQWFCLTFFGIRAYGQRNVPRRGPVILASTHQSFLDPILVQVGLGRLAWIMARQTLFDNRLFSMLIRSLRAFPIDRGTADLGALHDAIEKLRGGDLLLLFPEATRTATGEIGRIHRGIGVIAHRADAPVVPVTIDGAFECWPRENLVFRPGRIRVMYGEPMRIEGSSRAELNAFVERLRERLVEQQRRLHRLRKPGAS